MFTKSLFFYLKSAYLIKDFLHSIEHSFFLHHYINSHLKNSKLSIDFRWTGESKNISTTGKSQMRDNLCTSRIPATASTAEGISHTLNTMKLKEKRFGLANAYMPFHDLASYQWQSYSQGVKLLLQH
jgi:hypothetical protein